MTTTDLPDAITNPKTPKDAQGRRVEGGRWYRVYHGRLKPVLVETIEDPDAGELLCRGKGQERWQLVNQMDADVRWERVEESEL